MDSSEKYKSVVIKIGGKSRKINYRLFKDWIREGIISEEIEVFSPELTNSTWKKTGDLSIYAELSPLPDFEGKINLKSKFYWTLTRGCYVTIILFLINIIMFLFFLFTGGLHDIIQLVKLGAQVNHLIRENREWWRLITPLFLHLNFLHIIFNMSFLLFFGRYIEKIYGATRFFIVYFVSGITGNLLCFAFGSDKVSVGASSALFGLLGAALYFGMKYKKYLPVKYKSLFGTGMIFLLLLNIMLGFIYENLNNLAHLGGFIGGFVSAIFIIPANLLAYKEKINSFFSNAFFIVMLSLVIISFANASSNYLNFENLYFAYPELTTYNNDSYGYSVDIPSNWENSHNSINAVTFTNKLSSLLLVQAEFTGFEGIHAAYEGDLDEYLTDIQILNPGFKIKKLLSEHSGVNDDPRGKERIYLFADPFNHIERIYHIVIWKADRVKIFVSFSALKSEYKELESIFAKILGSVKLTRKTDSQVIIEFLTKRIADEPDDPDLRYELACELEKTGHMDEAVKKYKEILSMSLSYSKANYKLACYYSSCDSLLELAIEQAYTAVSFEPWNPYYQCLLGSIYYKLKDYENALESLNIASRLNKTSSTELEISIRYNLGLVYWKMGMHSEAEDEFSWVIEKAPKNELSKKASELIKVMYRH